MFYFLFVLVYKVEIKTCYESELKKATFVTDNSTPEAATVMWCTSCGVRLKKTDIRGWGCPKCKYTGNPCDPRNDVAVEINWLELRILTHWAERWALHCDADEAISQTPDMSSVLVAITRRLQQQYPDKTPLLLFSEINQLRDTGLNIELLGQDTTQKPVLELGPGAVGFTKPKDVSNV